jgi:hypothetical protein
MKETCTNRKAPPLGHYQKNLPSSSLQVRVILRVSEIAEELKYFIPMRLLETGWWGLLALTFAL